MVPYLCVCPCTRLCGGTWGHSLFHRRLSLPRIIPIELLMQEKISKSIELNHQPSSAKPNTKPCAQVPHPHCFLIPARNGDSTTTLGIQSQNIITISAKKLFLMPTLILPWCYLRPFLLVNCYQGEENNPKKCLPLPLLS